jgi:hypothetical protein
MDPSLLILAAVIGCIPGAIAQRKGYDFVTWWIFGALLFVVALPWSLMLKPLSTDEQTARQSRPWYTKL